MMKKKLTITICLILLGLALYAKGQGGVYMSAADFRNSRLTNEADCSKEGFKIHLHDFFGNTSSFTISYQGKKTKLQKSEVYGYRDCKDDVYRFYANAAYKLVEAGNIYVYTQARNVAQSKGFKVVNDYFFSIQADGAVIRLTNENLTNACRDNQTFLDLLANSRIEVTDYDNNRKTFLINYLYTRSLKN